jgi:hypothetical protein
MALHITCTAFMATMMQVRPTGTWALLLGY